jgi:plasmid replication initiation protein
LIEKEKSLDQTLVRYDTHEVVVQHNDFLETPKKLTLQEYKLFMFLVSKINPSDIYPPEFRISAAEFAKAVGIENSTYIYRDLQMVTRRLMRRVIEIHKSESELLIQTHLISSAHYWYGKGYVDIKISKEIAPYLLGLHRDFTQYKLTQITVLSSIYAVRIYELLKKQEKLGSRTFFVDDLRNKLGISEDKFKAFKDFRVHVLEISQREINEKTDISIDFEFVKTGRRITAVKFGIKSKNPHKSEKQQSFSESYDISPAKIEHTKKLRAFGFSAKAADSLLKGLADKNIENAVASVEERIKKGECKNPGAMLRTALKEKWTPSKANDTNSTMISARKQDTLIRQQSRKKKSGGFFSFLNKVFKK